jgi:transmembrane sensor
MTVDLAPATVAVKKERGRATGEHLWKHSRRRLIPVLAALAAAACFVLLLGPSLALRFEADHFTGTGEQRTVQLSDGSTVYLGPRSAISVVYSNERRQINLLQGEAFFDVAHDASRPFTVKAQNTGTTDIGTAFDIRLNERDTDIAVKQGLVELNAVDAGSTVSARLKAGDWARVDSSGQMERGSMLPDDIASWVRGQLIVKNQPAGEVIDQLRSYYHGLILVQGDELARQTLTGVYNLADPIGALRAVAKAQGATLRQFSPWMLVISPS